MYFLDNTHTPRLTIRRPRKKLTKFERRWDRLRYHPEQNKAWYSQSRFNVVPSGRRSGKTELFGKRKIVKKAMIGSRYPGGGRYFAAAPTRDQAKRIFWKDLKLMFPRDVITDISETELRITIANGSETYVLGLDKPERAEGTPWDHGCIDEIGNTKEETLDMHIRPALEDRNGSCDFIGVPEGRGHYYDLAQKAKKEMKKALLLNRIPRWSLFHWISADILPTHVIEEARMDMDELIYMQEYEGSFIHFTGRAYYNYDEDRHEEPCRKYYDIDEPLILCFDFNVAPGVASIVQELQEYDHDIPIVGKTITACMDEVYIKRGSTTPKVCAKIIEKYPDHQGLIYCYGDATGGSKGSAKTEGSDWEIVAKYLRKHYGERRVRFKVKKQNPTERSRINAVNSRLLNTLGQTYVVVDPDYAPMTCKDFEGVRIDDDTGEIDKKKDKMLSHLTDAIGYYMEFEYPVSGPKTFNLIRV